MQIIFHKDFEKDLKKLDQNKQEKVNKVLEIFKDNPYDYRLKNHILHGKLEKLRSIYVENDLRIIFKEFDRYSVVVVLSVGGHNYVY